MHFPFSLRKEAKMPPRHTRVRQKDRLSHSHFRHWPRVLQLFFPQSHPDVWGCITVTGSRGPALQWLPVTHEHAAPH